MSFWELTPDVTDLLCTLPPARDGICSCSHVGGYMFPHLYFRGGASAQGDLNSWPLLWPKPLQVVVIKIPPGAVQKTLLMTTWLQEGESVAHLDSWRDAGQEADSSWLLVHRTKEWFSYRPAHSLVLWVTFLSLVAGCYWVQKRLNSGTSEGEGGAPFPKGRVEMVSRP